MKNHKRKGQLGFTLIELLAVVAILGILAGVAVPRVIGALGEARTRANEANIAILQSAVERWGMDNNAGRNAHSWRNLLTAADAGTAALAAGEVLLTDSHFILRTALVPYIAEFPTSALGGTYRIEVRDQTVAGSGRPNFTATVVHVGP